MAVLLSGLSVTPIASHDLENEVNILSTIMLPDVLKNFDEARRCFFAFFFFLLRALWQSPMGGKLVDEPNTVSDENFAPS